MTQGNGRVHWQETYLLLLAGRDNETVHNPSQWFCNRCDTACGDLRESLCNCCCASYDLREIEGDWRTVTREDVLNLFEETPDGAA
jgi:hypothetical protein